MPALCPFSSSQPPTRGTHAQDSLAGIHRVSGGTFRDALVIVDDILVAALPPRVLAFVVQVQAEAEVHATPVLEVVVRRWAGLHTPAVQVEVAAGCALGGVARLRAVAQALAVAAEAFGGAAVRFTDGRADCREKENSWSTALPSSCLHRQQCWVREYKPNKIITITATCLQRELRAGHKPINKRFNSFKPPNQ